MSGLITGARTSFPVVLRYLVVSYPPLVTLSLRVDRDA